MGRKDARWLRSSMSSSVVWKICSSRELRNVSQACSLSHRSIVRKPSSVGPATCKISPAGAGSPIAAATRWYCSQLAATSRTTAYATRSSLLCPPVCVTDRASVAALV